jgi:hypothetical protein
MLEVHGLFGKVSATVVINIGILILILYGNLAVFECIGGIKLIAVFDINIT